MTVETATYISGLNSSNPGSSDLKAEGDDHLRLIKSTVKATFPNVTGAVNPTQTELNYVVGVTSAIQTQFGAKASLSGAAFTGAVSGITDLTTTGNTILGDASTDTLNVGANGLVKDASGNIGMGTATPSASLEVARGAATTAEFVLRGNAAAYAAALSLQMNADGNAYLFYRANSNMIFATNSIERLRIGSAGDITGLGVAISRSKSATTSRASTTTRADDPHLIAPLVVGTWSVDLWIPVWATTGGAGGFSYQMNFTGTASNAALSATISNSGALSGTSTFGGTGLNPNGAIITTLIVGANSSSVDWVRVAGSIVVTVAGNLSLQWAQNGSSANAANVGIGGWMNCVKVG